MEDKLAAKSVRLFLIGGVLFVVFWILWSLAIAPSYNIWRREQSGRAELAEAEWTKKVKVEEAKANLESQRLNAEAEVVRAEGAAKAQAVIAQTLTEPYLRYLWISKMEEGSNRQTIYVPTEAGLPILEAGRIGLP